MSSSATITQATVDGFRDLVRHLAQQKGSKARSWCDDWSPEAETGNWNRLSHGDANLKNTLIADTPAGDRVWSRRIAFPATYDSAEATEVTDPSKMLIDPKSNLVRSIGYSLGRQMDDIIFAASIGDATNSVRAGNGSNTPTQIALADYNSGSQVIGDYSDPISFDSVTAVNEVFNQNDLDDEDVVAFIGPRQVRELQNLTEVTSADYVNTQALMSRKIVSGWYGMTWIMSTRLPTGTTGQRDCIFMSRRAMGFHIPTDVTTFCERDPSKSYVWRPYGVFDAGAVRIEDAQVVNLKVADATVA